MTASVRGENCSVTGRGSYIGYAEVRSRFDQMHVVIFRLSMSDKKADPFPGTARALLAPKTNICHLASVSWVHVEINVRCVLVFALNTPLSTLRVDMRSPDAT